MANIDAKVASLIDRGPSKIKAEDSDDEDALIALLEEDDGSMSGLRERRLEQLHAEFARAKLMKGQSHGTYQTIREEKAVLDITTTTKLCVVHFFKPDFNRCRIMDRHLQTLAERHFDTRFIRVDVEDVPFLVTRLKIQVLPCVLAFVDGVSKDRILGFEGVGWSSDDIATADMEARLLNAGVLVRAKMQPGEDDDGRNRRTASKSTHDESDDDWDD